MKVGDVPTTAKPSRFVILSPGHFQDLWSGKPSDDVAIGLRLLSQDDVNSGRVEAERQATGYYAALRGAPIPADPELAVDVYNDALVMFACARGTCDPNDISKPYFQAAEDTVTVALTPEGARRIYDELVLLHKTAGSGRRIASSAEDRFLSRALRRGGVLQDDESRKLVAYLVDKLLDEGYREIPDEDDEESDEDGPAVYVSRAAS